ncbi:MAG: leucyl/phenylalanyl-tRNA--protein transferase [Bacteroidales bacterium]|nr:leucyl/phenylalanyl-tRNA--protein transferase [Bacteroidales bacterium]
MPRELKDGQPFPPVEEVEDGFIAYGGDLSAERLIEAYSRGILPYYSFRHEPIEWACPLDRFVIFPSEIHVSHSMRALLNSGRYQVTFNENFVDVIFNCSMAQGRYEEEFAWLGDDMIMAYINLHRLGKAESVEVWEGEKLVGGLYGVTLKGCFFGESMFSYAPSASKVALISLARRMEANGGKMIDCQYETPHLLTMGGRHIGYEEYMEVLER